MLGLASSDGLGITVGGSGKVRSVPPVLLTLVDQIWSIPLRAGQADAPRCCLPPRTKQNEGRSAAEGGWPEELTDRP